jgi:hypothetical protein
MTVADDDERRERKPPAALDDLGDTVDVHQTIVDVGIFVAVAVPALPVAPSAAAAAALAAARRIITCRFIARRCLCHSGSP